LKVLAQNGVHVDYVTIYLGNNDCTYGLSDKSRIDYKAPADTEIMLRVSVHDFKQNYTEMLCTIQEYGATPISIVPAFNLKWPPGMRSKKYPGELQQQRTRLFDKRIKQLFINAENAYNSGDYEMALENDFLLPRIKKLYRTMFESLPKYIPLLDAQPMVLSDDDFIDYCHPGERLNERIAVAIHQLLATKNMTYTNSAMTGDLPEDTYTLY
jgi:hypothetical protein